MSFAGNRGNRDSVVSPLRRPNTGRDAGANAKAVRIEAVIADTLEFMVE